MRERPVVIHRWDEEPHDGAQRKNDEEGSAINECAKELKWLGRHKILGLEDTSEQQQTQPTEDEHSFQDRVKTGRKNSRAASLEHIKKSYHILLVLVEISIGWPRLQVGWYPGRVAGAPGIVG